MHLLLIWNLEASDDIKDRGFEFNYNDGANAINASGATGILVTNVEGNLTGGTVNAAHFGKCDKGDACRSSHKEGDLADLKQDPRFKEWKSKLSPDDASRFHALECDNANLQQEVNHQAELLFH